MPGEFFRLCAIALFAGALAAQQSTTVNVQVANAVNTSAGVHGRLQVAMSTSFQLADFSYNFFNYAPQAIGFLDLLGAQRTRFQMVLGSVPLTAPGIWNFMEVNTLLPPIQAAGDHSPEFQIAGAPAFMNDANGHILPSSYPAFAALNANLVRYYNTGGFDASGTHFQSPSPYPITWWGIFNEPNGNGLTPQAYVNLYNAVAPAMAQADPSIKFAAVELADWGQTAESYLPAFISNVKAPVDVLATHFYSTCVHTDTDDSVLTSVLGFATEVVDIYSQLATKPNLAGVPVWVTENNVNADYDLGNGIGACSGQPFVVDPRGTSPFFAAWRSLAFQLLGQAGVQALYHWSFSGQAQYGEIDPTGNPFLSYWVDYYLAHWLRSPPGQDILQTSLSGCCLWISDIGGVLGLDTHTLALRNVDGSVVILMSNHALGKLTDVNGSGASRTFALDLSALGSFTSATLVTLDAATPASGPVAQALSPSAHMQVTLPGYGAALLRLSKSALELQASGVLSSASFASGPVAPGEIISLFGKSIGPSTPAAGVFTNPRLVGDSLAGVQVYFDGVPAPLLYASSGQVNAVVPYSVAGKATTQLQLEYLGGLSLPITLPVAATVPGVFSLNGSGAGQGAILNAINETVNSPANPAARGDWISVFATGAGVTTPASADGLITSAPLPQPIAPVSVTIGGLPCQLNYAGAAPGLIAGALQVNAQIPAGVTPGSSVPVQVTIGNSRSQAVTMAVR